ncbi:DNA (cytosine-5-)-methyltransferase [Hymenobacter sp. ISL-91]|uniref:DNA (cytosine-5-)-methyltransferase n=1 Tax=Hymenobacter sp. ISL-91 TaxID=2819151 RepID=UPI001BEB02B0|nr:DNA (cytosine-5-)-methyltransferase [Hymenobacter sp. ISL-91]MBT2558256.1 DNA (cytosine-5-)-methyltransferase [Hymenobacter sp. ISL-91]
MTGFDIRERRNDIGLSQSKLANITGIEQARISAYELGKLELSVKEVNEIANQLEIIDEAAVLKLKKKRFQNSKHLDSIIAQRPRRGFSKTNRNKEYLEILNSLDYQFTNPPKTGLKAISFFAGCGGLCYGVRAAGFEIVATNELIENYKDIYKLNFPNARFLPNDVQEITKSDINKILKEHKKIDLMVGGPPCQGFSLAGKRDVNDKRNTLFEYYLNIAEQVQPKVILIENVRLLTSMKDPNGGLVSKRILDTFCNIGYKSNFYNLNAKDYGVPQHRERVIFIAVRKDLPPPLSIAEPKYGNSGGLFESRLPYFTFGDGVSDLDFLESGESSFKDEHHWAVNHPEHVIRWLIDVSEGKSAHDNTDPSLRPPSGYNTTYKRQVWKEPAGTVATTYGMISGCRNVHPIATRALTTREALRLQSFPDSFKLTGNDGPIRTVIGNAVPPLLAFELAKFIKENYML